MNAPPCSSVNPVKASWGKEVTRTLPAPQKPKDLNNMQSPIVKSTSRKCEKCKMWGTIYEGWNRQRVPVLNRQRNWQSWRILALGQISLVIKDSPGAAKMFHCTSRHKQMNDQQPEEGRSRLLNKYGLKRTNKRTRNEIYTEEEYREWNEWK